jgi:hypothetical protein
MAKQPKQTELDDDLDEDPGSGAAPQGAAHAPIRVGAQVNFDYLKNGPSIGTAKATVAAVHPGDWLDLDVRLREDAPVSRYPRVPRHMGGDPQANTWRP